MSCPKSLIYKIRYSNKGKIMGRSSLFLKALFGAIAVVGFICLLLIGRLESGGNLTATLKATQSTANLKRSEALGRDKFIDLDVNYLSKRKVPNAPDPIHNRRAGNSGRPPGES